MLRREEPDSRRQARAGSTAAPPREVEGGLPRSGGSGAPSIERPTLLVYPSASRHCGRSPVALRDASCERYQEGTAFVGDMASSRQPASSCRSARACLLRHCRGRCCEAGERGGVSLRRGYGVYASCALEAPSRHGQRPGFSHEIMVLPARLILGHAACAVLSMPRPDESTPAFARRRQWRRWTQTQ